MKEHKIFVDTSHWIKGKIRKIIFWISKLFKKQKRRTSLYGTWKYLIMEQIKVKKDTQVSEAMTPSYFFYLLRCLNWKCDNKQEVYKAFYDLKRKGALKKVNKLYYLP